MIEVIIQTKHESKYHHKRGMLVDKYTSLSICNIIRTNWRVIITSCWLDFSDWSWWFTLLHLGSLGGADLDPSKDMTTLSTQMTKKSNEFGGGIRISISEIIMYK